MIDLSDDVVNLWLGYYYAANSVGFLVRHARNDMAARMISREEPEILLKELNETLSKPPEASSDVVKPYLLAASLAIGGNIKKEDLLKIDANHTKWFAEYVSMLFKTPHYSNLIMSTNVSRINISGRQNDGGKMMSNSSLIITGVQR
tara:strand:+ start:2008 stop:2448 length:441 start_codon:yes stop_codon:yes gene_type:complete